jgi:hypothetical protein
LILSVRAEIEDNPKPLNNVKIYGGKIGRWTTSTEEGTRRFWRSVFAGCASVRFHRDGPSYQFFGIGLTELAQVHIKSLRMFTDAMDFFRHKPANHLLSNRDENEAYCLAKEGEEYAIYFPGKGEVGLNVPAGKYEVRWLKISTSQWTEPKTIDLKRELMTPSDEQWAAFIKKM